jgi:hypothetical protein
MAAVQLRTKDGRLVGTLKGNTLYKTVRKSNHLFRKVGDRGAWGIDYEVLFEKMPERSSVYITELEDGILYMVTAGEWREKGTVMHFKEDTKDHYTQVFLPIEYFNRTKTTR